MSVDDSDFLTEYHALSRGRAYLPLTDWTSITLSGADRAAFLHNFCTNDVKQLQPGDACEAFVTDVKGKILGHGIVTCREADLVFVTVPNQAASLMAHLDRYLIREDVVLRDTSASRQFGLITGVASDEFPMLTEVPHFAGEWLTPIPSILVEGPLPNVLLTEGHITQVGDKSFQHARIEAGFPLYGIDFGHENLPQEIGRDAQAISFTKGCYLGQETVARIDALGHVNRRLVGVRFAHSNVPQPPLELRFNDAVVGHVTSTAYSPQLSSPLGLAIVRREASEPGTKLTSSAGECEIQALPIAEASPD